MAIKKNPDVVNLRERIKVRATEKNPHSETDKILEVHPIIAAEGFRIGYYEIVKEKK